MTVERARVFFPDVWLTSAPRGTVPIIDTFLIARCSNAFFSDRAKLQSIRRRHGIRRIALFGSVLKGTARLDSDIDLLVEFASGQEPGLFRLAGIEAEFSALLNGRRVDLRTAKYLSSHFRAEILCTAAEQYAA